MQSKAYNKQIQPDNQTAPHFKPSVLFVCLLFFDAKIFIVACYFPNRFMDEIQEKMVGMEEEASIVKDLYELMEKYQVPVSPEDHAVYQVGGGLS